MIFRIKELLSAINTVDNFADNKDTTPLSEKYAIVKFAKNQIRLSLYNEVVSIIAWANLLEESDINDSVTIDIRKLASQIYALNSAGCEEIDLTIKTDDAGNKRLVLKATLNTAKRSFTFKEAFVGNRGTCLPLNSEFAGDKKDENAHPIIVKSEDLVEALKLSLASIEKTEDKFEGLKDVLLVVEDNEVYLIGSSLKMLSRTKLTNMNDQFDSNMFKTFNIDYKAADVLKKILDKDDNVSILRTTDPNTLGIQVQDKFYMEIRNKNAKYAPYNKLFDLSFDRAIKVSKNDLKLALSQIIAQCNKDTFLPMFVTLDNNTMKTELYEDNELIGVVDVDVKNESQLEFAVYPKFLEKAIGMLYDKDTDSIELTMKDRKASIKLVNGNHVIFVMCVNVRKTSEQ